MGSRSAASPLEMQGQGALVGVSVKPKQEHFQSEHDKFLEDFEKPTAIYRLIRTTFLSNPRFLYRNLQYMENRMKRPEPRVPRDKFDTDILLKRALEKEEEEKSAKLRIMKKMSEYFNIIVLGFSDGHKWCSDTEAKVDIQLMKVVSTKRKESRLSLHKAFSSSCRIPLKSQGEGKYPVVPVDKECFNLVNGHIIHSIKLIIRVSIPQSKLVSKGDTNGINGVENIEAGTKINGKVSLPGGVSLRKTNGVDLCEEPKNKRHRSLPTKDRENIMQPRQIKTNENVVYIGVTSIFDKASRYNILTDGNSDVEIRLNRQDTATKSGLSRKRVRREGSWEISLSPDHPKVEGYLQRRSPAKLSIALRATNEKMASSTTTINLINPRSLARKELVEAEPVKENVRIVYYFVRDNCLKQSTECRNDFRCPWCSINCLVLYSLLKHLEVCHPRFKFKFSRIANGAKVDVSLNESFDGSYTGSAFDLVAQPPGQAFGRDVPPSKRTQVFHFHAFKPKKTQREGNSLDEFFVRDEKNAEQNRSYMIGHNRLYHHTTTCLPIHPREIDVDSEGEHDPEWLKVKTCMMIDEFTDVNEGEKEIMKMWNHHVMHDNYVGDCQIPLACTRFVDRYGHKIIEKNLYRNFILHLTSLFDFGLLPAPGFHTAVQSLHSQMKENNSVQCLKQSWALTPSLSSSSSRSTLVLGSEDMEVVEVVKLERRNSTLNGSDKHL